MMLVALLEIARWQKDSPILCKLSVATACREGELRCCEAGLEECPAGEVPGGGLLEGSVEA